MSIAHWYARMVNRRGVKYGVLCFWGVALCLSAWLGPKVISATSNAFLPPKGSQAAQDDQILAENFPQHSPLEAQFVIYCYSYDQKASVMGEAQQKFQLDFAAWLNGYGEHDADCGSPCVSYLAGYYILLDQGMPEYAVEGLVAPHNVSTIISFSLRTSFTSKYSVQSANAIQHALNDLRPADGNLGVEIISIPSFLPLMQSAIEKDFALMDGISVPLAMAVLAYMLRSVRLMVVPVLALSTSLLVSFAVLYLIALHMQIISFVPNLLLSIGLAFDIDYCLFMLSRYHAGLSNGHSPYGAVVFMMQTAGHTIIVSGVTIAGCFGGMLLFPLPMMRATGVGCGMAILVVLIVNLTLTPSLLLTFPGFFSRCVEPISWASIKAFWGCGSAARRRGSSRDLQMATDEDAKASDTDTASASPPSRQGLLTPGMSSVVGAPVAVVTEDVAADADTARDPLLGTASTHGDAEQRMHERVTSAEHTSFLRSVRVRRSFWYRIGWLTQQFPWNIAFICAVLAFAIPFGMYAFSYRESDSIAMDLPRGSQVTDAYLLMAEQFGYGTVYPYQFLFRSTHGDTVMSQSFFDAVGDVVKTLAELPETSMDDFTSVALTMGTVPPVSVVQDCLNRTAHGFLPYNSSACIALRFAYQEFVSPDEKALLVLYVPQFDPVSQFGHHWYHSARGVLNHAGAAANVTVAITGMPADSWSSIEAVKSAFYVSMLVTGGVVLAFIGVALRSVLVPLRTMVTIALTIVITYGFATLTYEYHALTWTHVSGLKNLGSIQWLVPIISYPIVLGISCDYDIFIVVGIREYRSWGMSTHDAIVKGITASGGIITAAGTIMAIAFGGLLLSTEPIIAMLSLYLCVAVLVDTFVVRPFVVPSIMGLLGDYNWWPMRMAPVRWQPLSPALAPAWFVALRNRILGRSNEGHMLLTDTSPTSLQLP